VKYFRSHEDYDVVFDVVRPDGKRLCTVEYDHDDSEVVADLSRSLKKNVTLGRIADTENMNVWYDGRVIAEIFVDAPYYRPKEIGGDQCRECGILCNLVNFAWVCPFHGVKT
jgi:hypothetical protein